MSPPTMHRFMRASAGTGKTYQLVEAYVAHVKGGLSPTNVVAITFTRKAAAELRSRIRTGLIDRGASRAELDALGRAPIANFHGLALQMLQSFGAEVGFTDVPTIMGELGEDERLFRIACEEAWFGRRAAVQAALAAVSMRMRIGPRVSRGSRSGSFIDAVWRVVAAAREEDDARPMAERFAKHDARAAQASVHTLAVAFRQKIAGGVSGLGPKARDQARAFLAHAEPVLGDDLMTWTRAWNAAFAELKGARLAGLADADERKELIAKLETPFTEKVCADLAPHVAVLVGSACERYAELKRETRSVDFADLLEQTSAALERDKALHARVRERFKVVLIDEAQDTNASQRRFVRLIAGLDGPARDSEPASLFVVGDRKQAIYTFRGADPRSFALFESDLMALGCAVDDLTVSRRSTAGVVRGVNHLGARILDPYEPLEPLLAADTSATPALTWLVPDCDSAANAAERAFAEGRAVATMVRRAVDEGGDPSRFAILLRATSKAQIFARALATLGLPSVITGGGGFYAQSEIVDLTALLSWLADPEAYFDAAVALRSPLVGFSDSALLHLFADRDRGMLHALRRGDISTFASTHPGDHETARALAAVLPSLVESVMVRGAGRAVAHVLDALDARAVLLALPFGEQKLANIERFAELAWNHERAAGRGTAHFAQEQREHARRGATEPLRAIGAARERAVSIMTVHQAKGLEFEHVILADLSQDRPGDSASLMHARDIGIVFAPERRAGSDPTTPSSSSRTLRSDAYRRAEAQRRDEQEHEMRRLLYVAVTRAREKLTFVSTDGARSAGFAKELLKWKDTALADGVLVLLSESTLGQAVAPGRAPPTAPSLQLATIHPPVAKTHTATPALEAPVTTTAAERTAAKGQLSLFDAPSPAGAPAGSTSAAAPGLSSAVGPVTASAALLAPAFGSSTAGSAAALASSAIAMHGSASVAGLSASPLVASRGARLASAGASDVVTDMRLSAAPPGTRFALSVTELEEALAGGGGDVGAKARRVAATQAADLTLDPLARGRLSHMVLAALHRLSRQPSIDHFINAELRICGYDPDDQRLVAVRDDLVGFLMSPLGRDVSALPAAARRHELPFVLPFVVGEYTAVVSGQIDLLYWDADGPVIVDFKHAHAASADAYATQLDAYAVAVARLCNIDDPIRTRLVFLRDRAKSRERTVTLAMRDKLQHDVSEVVARLARAPYDQTRA